ncbi:hypothetical protein PRO82_000060 [Candidatus Protochlamydia amoebophila]|nr:hypothetical protein [Candidatus Protochlamydia amoebophila]
MLKSIINKKDFYEKSRAYFFLYFCVFSQYHLASHKITAACVLKRKDAR